MAKKGRDDHGQGLGRREAGLSAVTVVQGNKPLAIVDNALTG